MSMLDTDEYELVTIDNNLVERIRNSVKYAEGLQEKAENGNILRIKIMSWIESFRGFIDQIDPLAESYSASVGGNWRDAQWYFDNHPKDENEFLCVFGRYLGVAQSILNNEKVKIVTKKIGKEKKINSTCVFHRRSLIPQDNLIFVLMPFTEQWSDYLWKEEIKRIIETIDGLSLICKRADDLFGNDVMQDIYESILTAKIIIAEITNRNANVFYELGMAHTLGKDVIILSQGAEHIPFDLNRFRHCIYSNDGPGYKKLRDYLPKAIIEIFRQDKA